MPQQPMKSVDDSFPEHEIFPTPMLIAGKVQANLSSAGAHTVCGVAFGLLDQRQKERRRISPLLSLGIPERRKTKQGPTSLEELAADSGVRVASPILVSERPTAKVTTQDFG